MAVAAVLLVAAAVAPATHAASETSYEGNSTDGGTVFFSTNDKLVPGDTDSRRDVYVRAFDVLVGNYVTRELSTGPTGGNDAFNALFEDASSDGTKAFFSTEESLVLADSDRESDVYLRDLAKGTTTLVSQGYGPCAPGCGNGPTDSDFAGVTGSGAEVFFVTEEQLTAADTDGMVDVYERDLLGGTTTLVSAGGSPCPPGCGNGEFPATLRGIAKDGSRVFFASFEQLVNADTDTAIDIYQRDLPGGPTSLVSQGDPLCSPGCGNSNGSPAVFSGSSADGSKVFFETAEGLVPGDGDAGNDVYQRSAGVTTQVSDGTLAQPANFAAASDDGATVFFVTAESLAGGDVNTATDVYVWQGAAPSLVTSGVCCNSNFGTATGDGGKVVFTTTEQLVAEDTDASADVYEQEVGGGAPILISRGAASCAPTCGNGSVAFFNSASADASQVFFTSTEQLVAADTDNRPDIYVHDLASSTTTLVSLPGVSCPTAGGCDANFNGASGNGDHVFFQTTERLTEGDVDSDADVYERVIGQTRLVSTGNSTELGPATPVLTGTNPVSPGASTTPAILGQSDPNTSIKLYTTGDCSGEVVAAGSSALLGAGIAVSVLVGSSTAFRATATDGSGDTSTCSAPISYKQENASPPPPPVGEGSPANGGTLPGGASAAGPGAGGKGGGALHVTPHTRITFAPAGKTRVRRPVFRFTDSTGQPGTNFQCKVDGQGWQGCGSPIRLKPLRAGRHIFKVRAVNAVGEMEPAPQVRKFKLVVG